MSRRPPAASTNIRIIQISVILLIGSMILFFGYKGTIVSSVFDMDVKGSLTSGWLRRGRYREIARTLIHTAAPAIEAACRVVKKSLSDNRVRAPDLLRLAGVGTCD